MAKLSNEDLSDLITKINRTSDTLDYCRSKLEKADTEEIVVPEWILRAVTVLIKRASTFNVALIDRLCEQKKRQN